MDARQVIFPFIAAVITVSVIRHFGIFGEHLGGPGLGHNLVGRTLAGSADSSLARHKHSTFQEARADALPTALKALPAVPVKPGVTVRSCIAKDRVLSVNQKVGHRVFSRTEAEGLFGAPAVLQNAHAEPGVSIYRFQQPDGSIVLANVKHDQVLVYSWTVPGAGPAVSGAALTR